nr:metallophosphoesterase [Brevibacterium paucivorans]
MEPDSHLGRKGTPERTLPLKPRRPDRHRHGQTVRRVLRARRHAHTPALTIKGNHEMLNPVSHIQHFRQPNQKGTGDYWYKDAGVLFIVLDSNNPNWKKHGQFIKDVKADQGRDANWTVVAFHHAPYSSGPHRDDADVKLLREKLPKYIAEADVDLVMNGHDHVYTRSYLTNGDGAKVAGAQGGSKQVKKKGEAIYMTATSSSGSKFYSNKDDADWAAVAKGNKVPGYVGVKAQRCSLRVTAYEVSTTGKRGTLDTFTLTDRSNRGCK